MNIAETIDAIQTAFEGRAKTQGYKPGTKTYEKLRLEFLLGALALAEAQKDTKLSSALSLRAMLASVGR